MGIFTGHKPWVVVFIPPPVRSKPLSTGMEQLAAAVDEALGPDAFTAKVVREAWTEQGATKHQAELLGAMMGFEEAALDAGLEIPLSEHTYAVMTRAAFEQRHGR